MLVAFLQGQPEIGEGIVKDVIIFFAKNSFEMASFAKNSKSGLTTKVINEFLLKKGILFGKLTASVSQQELLACIVSIIDIVTSSPKNVALIGFGPIGATAGIGLLLLDLIDVGNACIGPSQDLYARIISINLEQTLRMKFEAIHYDNVAMLCK